MSRPVTDPTRYTIDTDGCWLWAGCVNARGYGRVRYRGRSENAHRAVYIETHGGVPGGKELHHTCGVKSCVNPAHLEPMTRAEHVRREPRGNQGKLTPEDVHTIRTAKEGCVRLARRFGVTPHAIKRIRRNEMWVGV